jgi:hypothetical protein
MNVTRCPAARNPSPVAVPTTPDPMMKILDGCMECVRPSGVDDESDRVERDGFAQVARLRSEERDYGR